jgi:CcmD family protein
MMTTAMTTMTRFMMTITPPKQMRFRRALGALALTLGLLLAPASVTAIAQQTPAPAPAAKQPAATDQFVPIDEIPEQDKLPAAPYLIAAYMIAWLLLLFYVWSLWRRLQRVEDELKRLAPGASVSDH